MSAFRVPRGACDARRPFESNLERTKCSPAAPDKFLSIEFNSFVSKLTYLASSTIALRAETNPRMPGVRFDEQS